MVDGEFEVFLKIDKGVGVIDFHPGVYYTDRPEKVLQDVRNLIIQARQLRISKCKLIVGKGNAWRPGGTGTLMSYIRRMITSARLASAIRRTELQDDGGSLFLELTWPYQADTAKHQEDLRRQATQRQLKLDKAREQTNRLRVTDARNAHTTGDLRKSIQKISAVVADYMPGIKTHEPLPLLLAFLSNPESWPALFYKDLERILWELWFRHLLAKSSLADQKQQLAELTTAHDPLLSLSVLVDEIAAETDLRELIRLMLPHLPPNVVRV